MSHRLPGSVWPQDFPFLPFVSLPAPLLSADFRRSEPEEGWARPKHIPVRCPCRSERLSDRQGPAMPTIRSCPCGGRHGRRHVRPPGGAAAEVRPRAFLRRQGSGVVRLCGAGRNSSVPVLGLVPSLGSCPARTVRSSPHAPVCGMIPFRGPDIPACVRSGFAPACRGPYRRRKLAARPAMRASSGVPLSMAAA